MFGMFAVSVICSLQTSHSPIPNSQFPVPISQFPVLVSDSLSELYSRGKTWTDFFAAAKARKEMWTDNYANGVPSPEIVARVATVGGSWRILVVAEDWCGDSANTIPYIARLVEQVPSLELRIVNSKDGRWVMEQHRTPDGRAATPTVVLLGPGFDERGCFVERPRKLRDWVDENKPKLSEDDFQKKKMEWYKSDRGRETVLEIAERLEAAATDAPICDRGK